MKQPVMQTLLAHGTVYQESFAKENFSNMLIVTVFEKALTNLEKKQDNLSIWNPKAKDHQEKTFVNAPRFTKFANIFFREQFPVYGITSPHQVGLNYHSNTLSRTSPW